MKYMLIYLLLIISRPVSGQLSGGVIDIAGRPIPYASVSLLHNPDSTLVKSAITDENGTFKMDQVAPAKYLLKISVIGYQTWISPVFELNERIHSKNFGMLTLQVISNQLNEVIVRSDKPLLQQEAGGMVVNVQSSILTKGSSVLQVLQRSPGVIVNTHDNSISLNGKSGVMLMIDGKLMRMSMTQVVALLNGTSADDIEKIELLTTPPAKYDADGNAGLINIISKKNKRAGTNGSFSATAGYGKSEKGSTNININHNTNKIGLHGSYSYSHDHGFGELFAGGSENVPVIGGRTSFNYTGIGKPVSNYHDAKAGIDIQGNPKTSFGASLDYSIGSDHNNSNNHGNYILRPDSELLFNSYLNGLNHSHNLVNSFFIERQLRKESKINFDADYIYYKNNGHTEVENSFLDNHGNQAGAGDSLYAPHQRNLVDTKIGVGVIKIDYIDQLSAKLKLEAGVKGTYTRSYSTSGIENMINGQWTLSSVGVSNNLATREVIGAAYATLNLQFDTANNLILGGRFEYSHNTTDNASNPAYDLNRNLGKFFPTVFYTKKLTTLSKLQLSYTKRISRPSFSDLASYVTYNDPVSVFTGNPALKPTVTDNLKISYNHKSYLFSLLFSRDNDLILRTQISTGPSKGLVYLAPQNAPYQNNLALQVDIPVKINEWWQGNIGIMGGLRKYKIDYTPEVFEKSYIDYSLNFSQTFNLQKSLSVEISGYYNSSYYYATSKNRGNAMVNAGFKKELDKNKGTLQLSVSDVLRSASYYNYIGNLTKDAFDSQVYVRYNGESRSFPIIRLTYYYSFGAANKRKQQKTEDASQDERKRL